MPKQSGERRKADAQMLVPVVDDLSPLLDQTIDPPTAYCFNCKKGPYPAKSHNHAENHLTWFFGCADPECRTTWSCSNPWMCWKCQKPKEIKEDGKHWCGYDYEVDLHYNADLTITETIECTNPYHTFFESRVIKMTDDQKKALKVNTLAQS